MATREIRVGKITGLSSYQLAIKNGTFTGTLTEYLNKEQQYYNDMVAYGTELREYVNGLDISDAAKVIGTVGNTDISKYADGTLTGAVAKLSDESIVYADFDSFMEMESWLRDESNKEYLKIGDLLFIDDENVPNYWISDVYTDADANTGYFYKISKLGGTGEGGSGDGIIRIKQADYDALEDKTGIYLITDASGNAGNMGDRIKTLETEMTDVKTLINDKIGSDELSKYALKTEVVSSVQTAVSNLVDSAPETMDTLNELASAIQNHQGVADTLSNAIANKVDKVSGMGLSTNDYTIAEKNKLAGIEAGATKVVVDSSLSSTSTNPVQNKAIYSSINTLNNTVNTLNDTVSSVSKNINVKVSNYDSSSKTLYLVSI